MQDEVNEKVVSLAIKTSKLTAEVLQKAMKALLAKGKGQLTKAPHGKITMRQLMKQGEKVSNIEITDQNIKAFDPIARKSGLDYNVKKIENGKPPTYLVSFKGKDIDVMTEAFREFTAIIHILLIIPLRLSAICRRAHFVFYQKTFSKNF